MRKIVFSTTFLAIIACLLWSTAFVGVKLGLEYESPLKFAGERFFISGLMILPFSGGLKRHWRILRENLRIILLVALLNTFLQYMLFYTGLNLVPAALAAIIIGSGPIFIALLAHFMMPSDKMPLKKFLIFILGFMGIVMVSIGRNRFSAIEQVGLTGIIILLSVNLVSGLGNIFVARDAAKVPPFVLSSSALMIGGGSLFLFSLIVEGYQPEPKPPIFYGALAWLSFLSAAAFSIWFTLLKRPGVKVSNLNFWKFLIPVVGAILAWIIIPGERPTWVALIGMSIIAISLIFLNIYKRRVEERGES
jgi:drug/metabolite transporter (DMT)-like permease